MQFDYGHISIKPNALFGGINKRTSGAMCALFLVLWSSVSLAQSPSPTDLSQIADMDVSSDGATTQALTSTSTASGLTTSTIQSGPSNLRAQPIGRTSAALINGDDGTAQGIRIGTMRLRPSIQSQILHESETTGSSTNSRTYIQNDLNATLESNWSRHSLNISGAGQFQNNISGSLEEDSTFGLDVDLGLNLNDLITANINAGYDYAKVDSSSSSAVSGATSQAGIHTFSGSLGLTKEIGILRGSVTGSLSKSGYGEATLSNGSKSSQSEQNFLDAGLTIRLQYAANPSLMPFIEGAFNRVGYDQTTDSNGIKRSYSSYALRLGFIRDMGDKINGELAMGLSTYRFDDSSLQNINAFTINSALNWSPRRGTIATLNLATTLDPSTDPTSSGSIVYALNANITQQILQNLSATLGANYSLRNYTGSSNTPNQYVYGASLGLDWTLNRYLSVNADASYTKTQRATSSDTDNITFGLGLTLAR